MIFHFSGIAFSKKVDILIVKQNIHNIYYKLHIMEFKGNRKCAFWKMDI